MRNWLRKLWPWGKAKPTAEIIQFPVEVMALEPPRRTIETTCRVVTLGFANGRTETYHQCLGHDLEAALNQAGIRVVKETRH
jgi:hypothetical protein